MSFEKIKPVPDKNEKGAVLLTEKYCSEISEFNGYYYQPKLNHTLHLHYKAFRKIENLENFINLKTLYLENNCITKIENLSNLKNLSCLYLHNNLIETIENLENNTNLTTLNLSSNRIKEISGLSNLKILTNLYLEKNNIEEVTGLTNILECSSIAVFDISNNLLEKNEEELISIFTKMENLKVLYLRGNPIIRSIKSYRKFLIHKITNLTYLDDRPVDQGDKQASVAFFLGGLEAEKKVREEWKRGKDIGYKVRKQESEQEKISFEERKEKAMLALKNEYLKKKEYLENKKRNLIKEIEDNPKKKLEISRELMALDFQMKENQKLKVDEEREIIFTMAKRENFHTNSIFEYELWMDPLLITNIVENMFDFPIALKLIQLELKNRNIANYELFSEFELRSRWTDIELKTFRKNENMKEKENTKISEVENDKRIIFSSIKEACIDESIFQDSTDVTHLIPESKMNGKIINTNFSELD